MNLQQPPGRETRGSAAARIPSIASRDTKLAKIRRLNQIRGTPSQVDAGPSREIVQQLVERGMHTPSIARAVDVPYYRISRLLKTTGKGFPQKRVGRDLALRLEKVRFVARTTKYGRHVCGVRRRIEALIWNGWLQRDIAIGIGRSKGYLSDILSGHEPGVSLPTWKSVKAFYDANSNVYGGSARARAHAIQQGFAPPMAWDGLDIDNPRTRSRGRRRDQPDTHDGSTAVR